MYLLPFTFAYFITEPSDAGYCWRAYMLLQFLWPFSLHYCPPQLPKCGNAFVPMASSLLAGKPLRPWETPAHPTHACSESSLYAVVWGHLPGHCWGQLQYKKKAMQKPKSKTKKDINFKPRDCNCQFWTTDHISPFYKKIYEAIKSSVMHGSCVASGLKQLYSGSSSLKLGGCNNLKQSPLPAISGCCLLCEGSEQRKTSQATKQGKVREINFTGDLKHLGSKGLRYFILFE